jgi:O-antigen ligase
MAASEDVNTDTRVAIWRDTMQLIASQKWTGTGPGAYERGLYRFKTAKPVNTVDFAHNDYLQLLAELGIPGCILLAGLAGWIIRRPLNVALRSRRSPHWAFAVGLLGAFLAIGIHSLTDFNLYIPANLLALAWLAGLALSLPGEGTSRAAV